MKQTFRFGAYICGTHGKYNDDAYEIKEFFLRLVTSSKLLNKWPNEFPAEDKFLFRGLIKDKLNRSKDVYYDV